MDALNDASILITGGTGSFGRKFCQTLLHDYRPKKLIVFSRDELKQHTMRHEGFDVEPMRYFIGDVRDRDRLRRAMSGVDYVIHTAALKHVSSCEYNPLEAVETNIGGARNVIEAALDAHVKKVIALSTDKAVNPVNLYGATKLVSEKVFSQGNAYSGMGNTRFSCVRYGNVVGSSGSVVPIFVRQRAQGAITITDERMTRFWISLEEAVRFVIRCLDTMRGGEVFVPKIPSMQVVDLADALAPGCTKTFTGIRPGEKLHETLLSADEARHAVEREDMFVIEPEEPSWDYHKWEGPPPAEGFLYASNTNTVWLTAEDLKAKIGA
ncbi:MAG: UDP-N-acetylglucosamine 4,6-dehydratase (inverting) [Patescibacteria group bacterium]